MTTVGASAIFDLNGTIVNDSPFQLDAWRIVAEARGFRLSAQDYQEKVAGRPQRDVIRNVFGNLTDEEHRNVVREKQANYMVFNPADVEVPGAKGLISELVSRRVPVALATSASSETITFLLAGLNLDGAFDVVVQGKEVARGKPAPDIFLEAARRLGVDPCQSTIFEDSEAGVLGAKAAGSICVGISTTLSAANLMRCGADFACSDFLGEEIATLLA